jgi:DNA-binding transcriptional LysR family regulator
MSTGRTDLTLHQLHIFCAVAQADSLTRAAKQLGLAQPSLSQQLAKLEDGVGVRLFDRTLTGMSLTDAGRSLLRRAQFILNDVDEALATLREFSEGTRGIIRVAGLDSILRALLPCAMSRLARTHPDMEFDVHEVAPAEALELLYNRTVQIGLIAAQSVAQSGVSFAQLPVVEDEYALAVPAGLDLSGLLDPTHILPSDQARILHSCIQFNFGTQHTQRVAHWYQSVLPGHRLIAQCRSYEMALSLVRAGKGVCLVPALAARDNEAGIELYAAGLPPRRIVAVLPSHYQRVEPYRTFLDCLKAAGEGAAMPAIRPAPPFILGGEAGFLRA